MREGMASRTVGEHHGTKSLKGRFHTCSARAEMRSGSLGMAPLSNCSLSHRACSMLGLMAEGRREEACILLRTKDANGSPRRI